MQNEATARRRRVSATEIGDAEGKRGRAGSLSEAGGGASAEPVAGAAETGAEAPGENPDRGGRAEQAGAGGERMAARPDRRNGQGGLGTLVAFGQSGIVLSEGARALGQAWMDFTRDSLRHGIETAQSLMQCRSFEDMIEINNRFVRASFDNFFRHGARLSEISVRVTADTLQKGAKGEARPAESQRQAT
jgi:hypothetical protein